MESTDDDMLIEDAVKSLKNYTNHITLSFQRPHMGVIAFQIIRNPIACSTAFSG